MTILGIETSCDDTCAAVVSKIEGKTRTLSGVVSSQVEIHKQWGGIYPTAAKREHQKKMVAITKETLQKASLLKKGKGVVCKQAPKIMEREKDLLIETEKFLSSYTKPQIDAVAVTVGPGLDPCLWVGVNFARTLSCAYDIPIIPVDHIKAHIFANFVPEKGEVSDIAFPAICLVVSGGHTQLILMNNMRDYRIIGETRDDAAGECFDKTARLLGLPYPGGPAIAVEAEKSKLQNSKFKIKLPRPMMHSGDYDFSFSGLKTAVLYDLRSRDKEVQENPFYVSEMAKEIEEAITDTLVYKLIVAAKQSQVKTVLLGGGVTANKKLREKVTEEVKKEIPEAKVIIPSRPSLSMDNAEMIAITALEIGEKKRYDQISANPNLKICDTI